MVIALRSRRTRLGGGALALIVAGCVIAGCASSAPAPSPLPTANALDGLRRVVVVSSGESRFAVVQERRAPGREFDEVMKWLP
jgi:hypothetical protein